jgi:two-component system sensor histidine kinase/response regulator
VIALKKFLNSKELVGDPRLFSLEERIFNTVCIIAFLALLIEIPFNFIIGFVVPALICVFGLVFATYLYYLSRFKRKSSISITLFAIASNVCFTINYFYNSGIYGPNLLLYALVFLLIIAIIPKKQFKIWIPLHLFVVITVMAVEYFAPQLAPNVYSSSLSRTIDFAMTYLVAITLFYYAISYIRKNYDQERALVMDKSIAIAEKNVRILENKQELERLNSEKDKLFSIVTHDIRTPLTSIQGYLELLTEVDIDEAERLNLKKQLLQITRDSSAMLTNVLSWSRTQMEGAHAELVLTNIKDILEDGLNIEKNISTRKGVTLQITSEDNLNVLADRDMFQLVMRNLVNNAIKFTPKDGFVQIDASRIDDNCCIKIKDNGLGIDQEQQTKLFQFKASSTYGTNAEKGIGLGLLLCKEFTQLQGGEIWFESSVGEGSTFYLSFKLV